MNIDIGAIAFYLYVLICLLIPIIEFLNEKRKLIGSRITHYTYKKIIFQADIFKQSMPYENYHIYEEGNHSDIIGYLEINLLFVKVNFLDSTGERIFFETLKHKKKRKKDQIITNRERKKYIKKASKAVLKKLNVK